MTKYIFGLYFFFLTTAYSQQANLSGTVSNGTDPLAEVLLRAGDTDNSMMAITDEKGFFLIKNFKADSDSISIEAIKNGFKRLKARLPFDSREPIRLILEDSIFELDEVQVIADRNAAANKKTFKINSKDFIKNAKTDVVLRSLPSVSVNSSGITVDNRKKATVFIDGIESGIEDVKRLRADEVDKIDIIGNPSALYGSGNTDAVVQIFTIKKKERLFKSELESYAGIRLGAYGAIPSLSIKTKSVLFKAFYSYGTNNQNIESSVFRSENDQITEQRNYRAVDGYQEYFSSRLRIAVSSKSSLSLNGNIFSYKFNGDSNGSILQNGDASVFSVADEERLKKFAIGGVYSYSLDNNNRFFAKYNFFNYQNENSFSYLQEQENSDRLYSESQDRSLELVYERHNLLLFNIQITQTFGYKNINRDFYFQSSSYALKQHISSIYTDSNILLNNKLSAYASLNLDITKNKNATTSQNYDYLLAALTLSYRPTDSISIQANYSRKITRPGPNELNPAPLLISPIYILQGDSDLRPQLRNIYELQLSRNLQYNRHIGLTLFAEDTKHAIVEIFKPLDSGTIINSYENSGKRSLQGLSASLTSPITKHISLNLNSGVTYSKYESSSENSLVKENKGFSFVGSLYLNMLVKERLSLSLDGSYVSRNYSLISTSETLPVLNLYAEHSFFGSRLNARISYTDIFALGTETSSNLSYGNFSQNSEIRNRTTNITLTLIYSLGKKFNDRMPNKAIINDDIKLK